MTWRNYLGGWFFSFITNQILQRSALYLNIFHINTNFNSSLSMSLHYITLQLFCVSEPLPALWSVLWHVYDMPVKHCVSWENMREHIPSSNPVIDALLTFLGKLIFSRKEHANSPYYYRITSLLFTRNIPYTPFSSGCMLTHSVQKLMIFRNLSSPTTSDSKLL